MTFDLRLMHAYDLPWTISLLTLMLIAQAAFLSELRQTHRHTDRQCHRCINDPSSAIPGMGKEVLIPS